MTDEQTNAMLDLQSDLRAECNRVSTEQGIPLELISECLEGLSWLYEEAA